MKAVTLHLSLKDLKQLGHMITAGTLSLFSSKRAVSQKSGKRQKESLGNLSCDQPLM